ncbi:MAG: restriction endonuclease [Pirellulales bacterium]|nr:restriction endonuclease [Pirellulales bacterium]
MTITNENTLSPNETNEELIARHLMLIEEKVYKLREAREIAKKSYASILPQYLMNHCKMSYFLIAQFVRDKVAPFLGWRWAVVLIGAIVVGALCFMLSLSWTAGLSGIVFGATMFGVIVSLPSDSNLVTSINTLKSTLTDLRLRRKEGRDSISRIGEELDIANQRQLQITNQLEQLRQSRQYRLKKLATQNWKAMRGEDLEKFLEEVFSEQQYSVQRIGGAGDQGVDLIIAKYGKRIALQVKGYHNSVSNTAIQEAFTGMAFYKCDACAVITNSRFTSGGRNAADNVGCVLIDENTLPLMITEKIDLWQEISAKRA